VGGREWDVPAFLCSLGKCGEDLPFSDWPDLFLEAASYFSSQSISGASYLLMLDFLRTFIVPSISFWNQLMMLCDDPLGWQ